MSVKRETRHNSTKKRCPNGFRHNNKTDTCIKYVGFTVFKELQDLELNEDGKTLSIESLGDDGIIVKIYEGGNIIRQERLDKKAIEKSKENTKKDMKRMFKVIKRLEKDPNMIVNDKAFQRFKKRQEKKQKGGDNHTLGKFGGLKKNEPIKEQPQDSTKVMVQKNVIDGLMDNDIHILQKKVDEIQLEIYKEQKSIHVNWWSQFAMFNLFEMISSSIGYIVVGPVAATTTAATALASSLLTVDFAGAGFLAIMDIINSLYPLETISNITIISQYLYWIWIVSSTFGFLLSSSSLWILSITVPFIGMTYTLLKSELPNTNKISQLQDKLEFTKGKLAILMKKTYE